jgi:hypothetical protein
MILAAGSFGAPAYELHIASALREDVVWVKLFRHVAPAEQLGTIEFRNAWMLASFMLFELKNTSSLMMLPGLKSYGFAAWLGAGATATCTVVAIRARANAIAKVRSARRKVIP